MKLWRATLTYETTGVKDIRICSTIEEARAAAAFMHANRLGWPVRSVTVEEEPFFDTYFYQLRCKEAGIDVDWLIKH